MTQGPFLPPRRIPAKGAPRLSARDRALAAWRGVDVTPMEKARAPRVKSAASVIPLVLSDLRIEGRRAELEIVKVWNHAIDPTITAHAQPTGLHKGTLFVVVDSSVWLSEIVRYRRKEILARLQHSFGKERIGKISFRVG